MAEKENQPVRLLGFKQTLQMRIGIDGLPLTALKTGVGHYTYELARALARAEPTSQFEIVYPSTYQPIELPPQDGTDGQSHSQNLKLNRVQVGLFGRRWWAAGLPHYLRRSKYDVFHGTNYEVPLWRRCASVLTIHDLSHLVHPETHEKARAKRARRRLPVMVRAADAIITPTEAVRFEVCERFNVEPERVFAIPEAARTTFFPVSFADTREVRKRLGIRDDFLLAVGTLEPRKNLTVLLEAFEKFPQGATQLVIAGGKGWLAGPLFEQIKKSPLRDRIVLTDYLHDDDLRALYSSCRVFIYPSIYEGFGLPPLEAMACGAPVIASRIAALEENFAGASVLFDPGSADELAERLGEVLSDENFRSQLAAAGRRRAADFSWEKAARLTWDVYEKAVQWFSK
ncbi:MAG TPA: glycosyltransferase family 1 protein [Pyrinomonadaceae bacterium]|nr:glycosyltransferase family 1 protein [Pyrinomonadaceae bacterium]